MKKTIFILLIAACSLQLTAQKTDTIVGTHPVWIVYDMKDKPLKVYQMVEDCNGYCFANDKSGRKNQQINLYYGYRADSAVWKPNRAAIQEDFLRPESLADKWLAVDTVYVVMQEHFPIADRAYNRFRYADAYKYADNFDLKIIKLPYYYRTERSYEQIMTIKKKRLGIK